MTTWPGRSVRESPSGAAWRSDPVIFDDREVRIRVVADEIRGEGSAVDQPDGDRAGAPDDVAVREDEAVRREDQAGAQAAGPLAAAPRVPLLHFDLNDGGCDALGRRYDCLRIGVEEADVAVDVQHRRLHW